MFICCNFNFQVEPAKDEEQMNNTEIVLERKYFFFVGPKACIHLWLPIGSTCFLYRTRQE